MSYIMQGTRVDTNDRAMQFKESRYWKNLNIEHGFLYPILKYILSQYLKGHFPPLYVLAYDIVRQN